MLPPEQPFIAGPHSRFFSCSIAAAASLFRLQVALKPPHTYPRRCFPFWTTPFINTRAKPGKWELGPKCFQCAKGVRHRCFSKCTVHIMPGDWKRSTIRYHEQTCNVWKFQIEVQCSYPCQPVNHDTFEATLLSLDRAQESYRRSPPNPR